MFIKDPIFVNGFQRGGTNIFVNLIASSPEVGMLKTETHELFYGREVERVKKWVHRAVGLPVILATGQHTFWPYRYYSRQEIPVVIQRYIDLLFFISKMTSSENRLSPNGTSHGFQNLSQQRLLAKNVNAVVLTTPILADMYPRAVFIALVRHGLAICEGFIRRGWTPEKAGQLFKTIGRSMINEAASRENYFIVHFEDMIADPKSFLEDVYRKTGLDIFAVHRFRLQSKLSMNAAGQRKLTFGSNPYETHWFKLEDLKQNFRQDINVNQIARLSEQDKNRFLDIAHREMDELGYL